MTNRMASFFGFSHCYGGAEYLKVPNQRRNFDRTRFSLLWPNGQSLSVIHSALCPTHLLIVYSTITCTLRTPVRSAYLILRTPLAKCEDCATTHNTYIHSVYNSHFLLPPTLQRSFLCTYYLSKAIWWDGENSMSSLSPVTTFLVHPHFTLKTRNLILTYSRLKHHCPQ